MQDRPSRLSASLSSILSAMLCAACASSRPAPAALVTLQPPSALLACADAPELPAWDTATPTEMAETLVAAFTSGEDCRRKLRALATWATDPTGAAQ